MVEQDVQAIMDEEAHLEGNPYFDCLPVHKQDKVIDLWFGIAVQASCHPYLPSSGKLQMFL